MSKKSIAIYTATGCRACENAVLDIHYQVTSLSRLAEIRFWPYVLGSDWDELEKSENVDLCLFAGAISSEQDHEAAVRLREKSDLVIALGACAAFGGMPALSDLAAETDSDARLGGETDLTNVREDPPPLPGVDDPVSGLSQIIDVDYYVPGCPPTQNLVWAAIQAVIGGVSSRTKLSYAASRLPEKIAQAVTSGVLPPKGSTFAGEKAVCASCSRVKEEKRFKQAKRPYEAYEATGRCLLEQGLICQGIATREGCGGLCTGVGLTCRGCFGKGQALYDPGAKMVSAISSTFDSDNKKEIIKITEKFKDLTGTFYRYTLATQCELLRAFRGKS